MKDPPRRDAATQRSAALDAATGEQNRRIAEIVTRESPRLRNFIRRRVADPRDVEDILQDVFYAFVETNRLLMPIEQVTGWLYRVARNRIIDLFRKQKPEELPQVEEVLPAAAPGPDEHYERRVLLDALGAALAELPKEQREVFLAHEFEGRTFNELAAETGVSVNTLLSRKRYAVQRLRRQLQEIHDDFMDTRS
jgi:RNA polymerase sigma factor (sigma-70 family)